MAWRNVPAIEGHNGEVIYSIPDPAIDALIVNELENNGISNWHYDLDGLTQQYAVPFAHPAMVLSPSINFMSQGLQYSEYDGGSYKVYTCDEPECWLKYDAIDNAYPPEKLCMGPDGTGGGAWYGDYIYYDSANTISDMKKIAMRTADGGVSWSQGIDQFILGGTAHNPTWNYRIPDTSPEQWSTDPLAFCALFMYTNDEDAFVTVQMSFETRKSFMYCVLGEYRLQLCLSSKYGAASCYTNMIAHETTPPDPPEPPEPPEPPGPLDPVNPYEGDGFDGSDQKGGRDIGDTASDFGKSDTRLPVLSGIDTGFFSAYRVTPTNLKAVAERLWETTFWDAVLDKYRNPGDMINGLYMLPFQAKTDKNDFRKWYAAAADATQISGGGHVFTGDAKGQPLLERYVKLKFGKAKINSRWDAYPDYGEFKQVKIYIPYCGEYDLDVNTLMSKYHNVTIGEGDDAYDRVEIIDGVEGCTGCELSLEYVVDVLTGACVALVKVNDKIRYQFTGNMQMELPFSWATRESAIANIVGAAGALVGGLAIGGPLGLAVAEIGVGSNVVQGVAKMGAKQSHVSGSIGAIPGGMQFEYPYVTVLYPSIVTGENQDNYIGRAAPCTTSVGEYSGFVQVEAVHLDGVIATDAERAEIESMLKEGVII